jgi:hypothetical protein
MNSIENLEMAVRTSRCMFVSVVFILLDVNFINGLMILRFCGRTPSDIEGMESDDCG